ncbi:serine dehydratase beta chain [Neobacillus sp. SuZ13]|uniref:serine dehydratase beta chain n=1 Tax=Neobacillus sp. SuZ13 TaxID=3047875 RepID=UPI0024C05EC0|nr:serine dehydratase beta chain [Neobacillus sp. SuZ13]WHY68996.1 serine dehydratase beta chain [Neobacillus sp. SuZ13]
MEFQSCFDIIGPIMVGPSSSHTAGVVSIGKFIYELLGRCPEETKIVFFDSFAETYQGHGTDKALIGGLIGMNTDDPRIKNSLEWAKEVGMQFHFEFEDKCTYYNHPNTTIVTAKCNNRAVKVGGVSLGGGLSKIFMINGREVDIRLSSGDDFTSLASHYQPNEKAFMEAI